jgi:hypothetical protein
VYKVNQGDKQNVTNELGYKKQNCLASVERLHRTEHPEKERTIVSKKSLFATIEVQDDQVGGQLLNCEEAYLDNPHYRDRIMHDELTATKPHA